MNDLNTVLLEGKLTRDPSLKCLGETEVCTFAIAVNKYFYKKETREYKKDVSYFIIECWGNMAATCGKYLRKGRGIRVVGRLRQVSFKDCGIPRERVYIVAEHIEFQPHNEKKEDEKPQENTPIIRQTADENEKMESEEVATALDNGASFDQEDNLQESEGEN